MHGTTGVIEDNADEYRRAAVKANLTAWVGTHVGAYEHGGAYWDDRDVLRYRYDNSPVRMLWFSFNHRMPELVGILTAVLQAEGLTVEPRERDTDGVCVWLEGAR